MKKMLMITGCSNSSFWYAEKVGSVVDYLGSDRGEYITREPSGFVNIIKFPDAELVDVTPSVPECAPPAGVEAQIYRLVFEVAFNKPEQIKADIGEILGREALIALRHALKYRSIDAVAARSQAKRPKG